MKRILYSLLIAAVILPGATAHLQARDRKPKTSKTVQAAEPVRNVILMIGDGMGLAQVDLLHASRRGTAIARSRPKHRPAIDFLRFERSDRFRSGSHRPGHRHKNQ
ncbi:MAG: hypothetical protein ACLR1G_10530 [Alistipes indistinctus]